MITQKYNCCFCGKEFKYRTPDFIIGFDNIAGIIPATHVVLRHRKEMRKENWKDICKIVLFAVSEIALGVVLLPIFLLTYPFWWLHEKLF